MKTGQMTPMTIIQAIDQIIEKTQDQALKEESIDNAQEAIKIVSERLDLTPIQCVLFAAFICRFDDRQIRLHDLARYFECTQIKILSFWDDIEHICAKKYVNKMQDNDGDFSFNVPNELMEAIRKNITFVPKSYANMDVDSFCDRICELMESRDRGNCTYNYLLTEIQDLIKLNMHLDLCKHINKRNFEDEDLILFLCFLNRYIQYHDNHIITRDFEDILPNRSSMRNHARLLENGDHTLQERKLVEYSNAEGMVETNAWQLTDLVKDEFLLGVEVYQSKKNDKTLMAANGISEKKLYFNESVTKQIDQLCNLLHEEKFHNVQQCLDKHGMRKGFACIFYGAPGTGKTETVLQLARKTGRSIMMVDVPNLRSKWVGDTEKNTKEIFENYRRYCKKNPLAPILLFNEADAVLCRRNEGAASAVDKMENAMQNIILQEMETLDGIMIATTNLTGNLDAAFERRFLYKIEFPKPTPNESKHIWHAMLPALTDDETYALANSYEFSGGQIENIARKQIVDSILLGTERPSMEAIRSACDTERFNKSKNKPIGFN